MEIWALSTNRKWNAEWHVAGIWRHLNLKHLVILGNYAFLVLVFCDFSTDIRSYKTCKKEGFPNYTLYARVVLTSVFLYYAEVVRVWNETPQITVNGITIFNAPSTFPRWGTHNQVYSLSKYLSWTYPSSLFHLIYFMPAWHLLHNWDQERACWARFFFPRQSVVLYSQMCLSSKPQ